MLIEVWADFHCPYCYIGKERFQQALAALGLQEKAVIVPRSFMLNPVKDRPEGLRLADHVQKEYGTPMARILENFKGLDGQAARLGLPMEMAKARFASMMDAHRLLHHAQTLSLGNLFFRKAQEALFAHGAVLSHLDALLAIAADTGLKEAAVKKVLAGKQFREEVLADDARARKMNIDYVPYYLVDGSYHFSGDLDMGAYQMHLRKAAGMESR